MPIKQQNFTIIDPRELDGNPYEVAQASMQQAEGLARLYSQTLKTAFLMARNAEMERQLHYTGEADPQAFLDGPQARKIIKLQSEAGAAEIQLSVLSTAVAYDPKNPPKA